MNINEVFISDWNAKIRVQNHHVTDLTTDHLIYPPSYPENKIAPFLMWHTI